MKFKNTLHTLVAVFVLSIPFASYAQVVLWGQVPDGGNVGGGYGNIFSVTSTGVYTNVCNLTTNYAAFPEGSLLYASDGNFYASTVDGGFQDSCTIYRYANTGVLHTMINLDSVWGSSTPEGNSLIQGFDGNLYGMTTVGGTYSAGVLFKLNLSGNYAALHFFNDSDGNQPHGSLIQTKDSMLWGMTMLGGANSLGNIFHCSTSGILTSVFSFNDSTGNEPYGDLLLASDGNFYGLTSLGGKYGNGTLFRFTPSGTFTKLIDFDSATNGSYPYGSLIEATDSNLYGMTSGARSTLVGPSAGVYGTIFKFTLAGNLSTIATFNGTNGGNSYGSLIQASDGYLYGMTSLGGIYNDGTVFQCSLAGTIKKLTDFNYTRSYVYVMYGHLIEQDTAQFAFDTTSTIDTTVGVKRIVNSENISLFPNPNNGQFTIQLSGISGQSSVEIYNMLGEKVYSSTLPQTAKGALREMNLSTQSNGVYLYRILDENGNVISSGKFVIEK